MHVHMFGSVGMLEWSKKIKSEKSIWGIIPELGHRKLIKILNTILEELSSSCE